MFSKVFFILTSVLITLSNYNNCEVDCANILGLLGMTSPSIQIWNTVLLYRLAELGHNVTLLSVDLPRANEKIPPNVHYIHLERAYAMYESESNGEKKIELMSYVGVQNPFKSIPPFYAFGIETCKGIVASKGLKTLLAYPDEFKFDLIFNDYTLGPYLLGFLHKFRYPPLIGLTAYHNSPLTIDAMANHYFPAYVPYHSTIFTTEMNFYERLENTLLFIADTVYRRMVYTPQIDAIMRPYFDKDMPYLGELSAHTAISMVNSHPAIDYAEPLPPNVIEVGGMQILDAKPLPRDLDEFMNKSQKGVVFISFGTNMKSEHFGEERKEMFLNAILELPEYNFLWKFDKQYLRGKLPKNLLVQSFFPQRDILAHPKIKAFVTHCGGLSSQEATWRGVPMIGIPLFLDQHRNLRQSMLAGVAEKIDFLTMTSEVLRDTIKRVAEDVKMAENVRIRSQQFRDQPMKPLDLAVWWAEYLLRNPKPSHLQLGASKLNIFQANSVDVLVFLWTVIMVLMFVFVKLILVVRKYLGKKTQNSKKLKRN